MNKIKELKQNAKNYFFQKSLEFSTMSEQEKKEFSLITKVSSVVNMFAVFFMRNGVVMAQDISQIQDKGNSIMGTIYSLVFNWGGNLLILAILICIIGFGFSSNPQKKEMYKSRGVQAGLAFVGIKLIQVIVDTLSSFGNDNGSMPTWN